MKKLPKIGDMIRYNAGGMRGQTLGIVFDINKRPERYALIGRRDILLIQWCAVGKWMPRRAASLEPTFAISIKPPVAGEFCWHELGAWFEVI